MKKIYKNISCAAQSSLSSVDDIIVTPPSTPSTPPPPPKPTSSKNPQIVVIGPKPAMQRTPIKVLPQQQNDVAGAAATPTVTQPPAASQQTEPPRQTPVSQGFEPYRHPNSPDRNTPATGRGGAPANAAAAAAAAGSGAAASGSGTATGTRPRNTPRNKGVDTVGVGVDDDEIPDEDLKVNEEIEKTVDETPQQKEKWRQLIGYTIRPRQQYQKDLKLVLKALRNSNDWRQVATLFEQMEQSFVDWETKRTIAMSERDGQIRENDELIIRLTTEFAKVKNQVREFVQQQQYQQQMQESAAAAEQNIVNMESLADQATQGLHAAQERAAEIRAQEDRAAAAANFAAAAGGIVNPPPFTEAGGGIPPPFNNEGTHATTGKMLMSRVEHFLLCHLIQGKTHQQK